MTEQAAPILTPEQELAVLAAIAESAAPTLKRALAADGLPRPWQVLAHAKASPEFAARLDATSEVAADEVHDDMVDIEAKVVKGAIEPAAANAALSSKRWRLQRMDRRRWGDKVEVEHGGKVEVAVTVRRFTPPAPESSS